MKFAFIAFFGASKLLSKERWHRAAECIKSWTNGVCADYIGERCVHHEAVEMIIERRLNADEEDALLYSKY